MHRLSAWVLVLLLVPGCAWYSFTGASIPEHLQTVAIPLVEDNTVSTVTGLDDEMTRLLVDRFVRQTRLNLETDEQSADALLRVVINRYTNQPTSVSGQEQATRNRVTVAVQVTWVDQTTGTDLVSRSFSAFEEYDPFDPSQEETAAFAALEKIADDVFTAATSNW
ncbi:MAG: LptE family protein [Bacteroidetes bacterium]|nr:LptE family protein [Bacteroidota bacterium]MDA0874841.1 LptE family protein [Bacteroidota bacterium]